MGHVGMVNELELLDDSNSSFHFVTIYDVDSGEVNYAQSRSANCHIDFEELPHKINEEMMKKIMRNMRGPEIFEAEILHEEEQRTCYMLY